MSTASNTIDGFSVDNILQMSSAEKKSHVMVVRCIDAIGYIYIKDGDLIDATSGDLEAEDAIVEILCWDEVQIELKDYRERKRAIDTPLMKLLLDASKHKDERMVNRLEKGVDLLENAIELAEAHKYKAAHKAIVTYLKKNKNNAGGWVWYSRIHGNLAAMQKALDIAYQISPSDSFVVEEKKKLNAVKEKLNGEAVGKCYFCWAPQDKHTVQCHHCSGYLSITKEALSASSRPHPAPFKNALRRYTRVQTKYSDSQAAHYCLSLAHLNMGNLKETLHSLDTLTKYAPKHKVFGRQLTLVMDYLASTASERRNASPLPPAPLGPQGQPADARKVAPIEANKKKILVVEDSPTIRKVITITLKRSGYDIVEAEDGLEALSRISEGAPDLILLDVILPKMDGFKILSLIKGNKELKAIPVIMLTSKDGFINKVKGKVAGASAYLTKPFDPKKMIGEIEKHI